MMQPIPLMDIREQSPVALVERFPEKARLLVEAGRDTFGFASRAASALAFPLTDRIVRAWLARNQNPYADEIARYHMLLQMPGIFTLNLAYEWGCTSGVHTKNGHMALSRILDWPFPALGEHLVVAHQRGSAGEFHNVTWPAVSGVYNAMAQGRFAATLNMAPIRRSRLDLASDWVRGRARVYRSRALPPSHLLRQAFETAPDYASAKRLLSETPVASPVIYLLCGLTPGQGCVIERTEEDFALREVGDSGSVCAANHFESPLNGLGQGWTPRPIESHARARHAATLAAGDITSALDWFQHPSANAMSRLVLYADPSSGSLSVQGTFGITPVTPIFMVPA